MDSISTASRSSLAEIRRLVGALRATDGDATAPLPGLADLPGLAAEVTAAGLDVDLVVDGPDDAVPAGVGLAGYRVVQEALTNALRHGHGTRAWVRRAVDDGERRIEVSSFVSPRAVPQMADAAQVMAGIERPQGLVAACLVPNANGARRAAEAKVDEIF